MMSTQDAYYIPHKATWPIAAVMGLVTSLAGFANYLNGNAAGSNFMLLGLGIFIVMLAGWFTLQANESESGMYNQGVGISYRMGMMWFIFSEIMFFTVFFGTLWYTRNLSMDWLAGIGDGPGRSTEMLWPSLEAAWPWNGPAHIGGEFEPMGAFGLPLLNTLILLTSGVTCTWAHHGLLENNRGQLIKGLAATVTLGFLFVHVCVGAIILSVVLFRSAKGHLSPKNHFVFEAAAWYWHFVDVVWLGLFIFVYLM